MKPAVILIAFATITLAGKSCNDGKDNAVSIGDINDASMSIHFKNVVAYTYLDNGRPSCADGYSQLSFPGKLKLASGTIQVSAANDLTSAMAQLYLHKKSIIVGTVCEGGKSHNALIPNKDCNIALCTLLGSDICKMLSTPGTYDLSTVEKELNISSTVELPEVKGVIKDILKGLWQVGAGLVLNGKTVADIKLPANEEYIAIL